MVSVSSIVIRVGFILAFDAAGWLGGVSYYRNLLGALRSLPRPRIEPVILTGTKTDGGLCDQFPAVPLIRSSLLDWRSAAWMMRRISAELLGRDIGLERIVRQHQLRALSHEGFFGSLGAIPVLGWIPDFQEHHLPQFFSEAQIKDRARKRSLFCRVCTCLILSSSEAKRDLKALNPLCGDKARVLHFVANIQVPPPGAIAQTISQFGVRGPYFYLPNQFWQHKNHGLVIEALRLLKERDIFASVVASGNTMDPRRPGHFDELMMSVKQAKVEDRFLPIGVITYPEVLALMAGSLAVINPSFFEGWSTTVEEAKSMGKVVLLSDIPVHREQAPQRGRYFHPNRADDLALLMAEALGAHDETVDRKNMLAAQEAVPARIEKFAQAYEEIVLEQIV